MVSAEELFGVENKVSCKRKAWVFVFLFLIKPFKTHILICIAIKSELRSCQVVLLLCLVKAEVLGHSFFQRTIVNVLKDPSGDTVVEHSVSLFLVTNLRHGFDFSWRFLSLHDEIVKFFSLLPFASSPEVSFDVFILLKHFIEVKVFQAVEGIVHMNKFKI